MSSSTSVSDSSSQSPRQDPRVHERVSAAFEKLKTVAAELNAVSDELAKPISAIDTALQRLSLGVSAWVEFAGEHDPNDGSYLDYSLGYTKAPQGWGLVIRSRTGNDLHGQIDEEFWRFNDAPRLHRLSALEKLPELLEQLAKTSSETTQELRSKVASTKEMAATVREMVAANPVRRK